MLSAINYEVVALVEDNRLFELENLVKTPCKSLSVSCLSRVQFFLEVLLGLICRQKDAFSCHTCLGRGKLLSAAGSAVVLFDGIKESWRLAWKILFLVLLEIREMLTLLAILHLEIAKTFLLLAVLSNLTRPCYKMFFCVVGVVWA